MKYDGMPPKADLEDMELSGEPGRCDYCGADLTITFQGERVIRFWATPDRATCQACEEWGPPCQRCGERGSLSDGDEDDCRSADCLSRKVDAAMDWGDR